MGVVLGEVGIVGDQAGGMGCSRVDGFGTTRIGRIIVTERLLFGCIGFVVLLLLLLDVYTQLFGFGAQTVVQLVLGLAVGNVQDVEQVGEVMP